MHSSRAPPHPPANAPCAPPQEQQHSLIATVAVTAAHPTLVVTGAQDGSMLVYDVRAPASVGALGQADAGGGVRGHTEAITCVDAMGDVVLSTGACRARGGGRGAQHRCTPAGPTAPRPTPAPPPFPVCTAGLDAHVKVWDLRLMATSAATGARPTHGPLAAILVEATPDVPILKLAYANSPRPTLAAFASQTVRARAVCPAVRAPQRRWPARAGGLGAAWHVGLGRGAACVLRSARCTCALQTRVR